MDPADGTSMIALAMAPRKTSSWTVQTLRRILSAAKIVRTATVPHRMAFFLMVVLPLPAASSNDVIRNLERYPGRSTLQRTLRVECRTEHSSTPKEPIREMHQDLKLRTENGELWTQQTSNLEALEGLDLRQIMDPRSLIREWMTCKTTAQVTPNPAERLVFQVPPQVPARLKHLWESEGRLDVWLATDGSISHAHLAQRYKGRTQRIAPTEEMKLQIDYTFKVEGDHLLLVRMEEVREEVEGYDIHKRHRLLELRN